MSYRRTYKTNEQIRKSAYRHATGRSISARDIQKKETQKVVKTKNVRAKNENVINMPRVKKLKPENPAEILLKSTPLNKGQIYEYPVPDWFATKSSKIDVSVIIPLYKSNEVLKDHVEAWLGSDKLNVEIVYVEDCCPTNSKQDLLKFWEANIPLNGIGKIIYKNYNSGFGQSCNVGASYAKGKYLIFLNADTTVTPNWIEPIVDLLENPNIGIVGNLQIKDGGRWHNTIDSAGSEWLWDDENFLHIGRHSYQGKHIKEPYTVENAPADILTIKEVDMVTGCCFGITKELFDQIDGFDVNYRVGYWEDSDISMKVKDKGYKVFFTPLSKIYHKLSHSGAGGHEYQNFNKSYFYNKWIHSGLINQHISHPRPHSEVINNILVKRNGANGDVLVASYLAGALKAKYPTAKITFITGCIAMVKYNPYIDIVSKEADVDFSVKYNLIYNLDYAYENYPNKNILNSYADATQTNKDDAKFYFYTEPYQVNLNDYIVFHAGKTSWSGRNWSVVKFNKIATELREMGHKVVCIGTNADGSIQCDLDLRGKTSLHQLGHIIKNSKLFVGIDSLPFHITQCFNIPGVVFFGCVRPESRIYRKNIEYVTALNLDCLGCHHNKPIPCTVTNECARGDLACEELVTAEMMLDKIKGILK